jgi:hypothetical protein
MYNTWFEVLNKNGFKDLFQNQIWLIDDHVLKWNIAKWTDINFSSTLVLLMLNSINPSNITGKYLIL